MVSYLDPAVSIRLFYLHPLKHPSPQQQTSETVGIEPQLPTDWLTSAVPGMTSEFNSGDWNSDDLLGWCVNNKQAFWWQSHTLTHLARDNLGESDCTIEDGGECMPLKATN